MKEDVSCMLKCKDFKYNNKFISWCELSGICSRYKLNLGTYKSIRCNMGIVELDWIQYVKYYNDLKKTKKFTIVFGLVSENIIYGR